MLSRTTARVRFSASNSSEHTLSHTYLMEGGSIGLSLHRASAAFVTLQTLCILLPPQSAASRLQSHIPSSHKSPCAILTNRQPFSPLTDKIFGREPDADAPASSTHYRRHLGQALCGSSRRFQIRSQSAFASQGNGLQITNARAAERLHSHPRQFQRRTPPPPAALS